MAIFKVAFYCPLIPDLNQFCVLANLAIGELMEYKLEIRAKESNLSGSAAIADLYPYFDVELFGCLSGILHKMAFLSSLSRWIYPTSLARWTSRAQVNHLCKET